MWKQRLQQIGRAEFGLISLNPDSAKGFDGRYLRLDNEILALGREIATGAEARVYELIDIRVATLVGVAKICLYPAGSNEYRRWAVPYRFEGNLHSAIPDVELQPSRLVNVSGGIIKVQEYFSENLESDWATEYPAVSILNAYQAGREGALDKIKELTAVYGPHGVYLELQGLIQGELGEWKEACKSLELAMNSYRTESRAGFLRSGLALANAYNEVYVTNQHEPDVSMRLDLGNGLIYSQKIFQNVETVALDDSLQDKNMYILFEILHTEPFYIPALFALAKEFLDGPESRQVIDLIEKTDQVDPNREDVADFRAAIEKRLGVSYPEWRAAGRTDNNAGHTDTNGPIALPDDVEERLGKFEKAYQPEPLEGQTFEARLISAMTNLNLGRLEEAERAAKDAISLNPEDPDGYLMTAKVLCAKKQFEKACSLLEKAVREIPGAALYEELGNVYMEIDKFEQAIPVFLRALVLAPEEPWRVELGLGVAYRMSKQKDKAVAFLRKAYQKCPADPAVSLELAQSLRMETDEYAPDLSEALVIIDRSLAINSNIGELLVCKAQLLGRLGRIKEAIPVLEEAVLAAPDHPIALPFLNALKQQFKDQ